MGIKEEAFVPILNEISISRRIWYSSVLVKIPFLPSPEKSEYLEWEQGIYFYNKFSGNWNVGMPAKVSELISRNLWLLAWKMKEEQPSAEPHSCGWAQFILLIIIKGCQCAQCMGSQSNPQMSSDAQFLNHHRFFHNKFESIPFTHCYPQKRENCTLWMLKIMLGTSHTLSCSCVFVLLHLFLDGSNYVAQAGFEDSYLGFLRAGLQACSTTSNCDHWA